MAQLKTIVGIYCTGSYTTFNNQTISVPKARVAGLMLYDAGSQQIKLEQIGEVIAKIKNRILILDNADLSASQAFSLNAKNPAMSIPASPLGCTTCPIDMLPCYFEQNQQPRERYIVARIVDGSKTIGYRLTQGFIVKEFKTEDIFNELAKGTITLCNAKAVDNKYFAGRYAPILDIELSRVKEENRLRPILDKAMRMQPITMQEARSRGFIVQTGNILQVKTPFLLSNGANIELITPYTQADMNEYKARVNMRSKAPQGMSTVGRPVVRSY